MKNITVISDPGIDDLVALAKALGVSVSRLLRPYLKLGLSVHRELDQKANSTKVPLEVLLHRYFRVGQKLDEIGGRSTDGVIDLLVKPYHYGNGDGGEQELVRLIMG